MCSSEKGENVMTPKPKRPSKTAMMHGEAPGRIKCIKKNGAKERFLLSDGHDGFFQGLPGATVSELTTMLICSIMVTCPSIAVQRWLRLDPIRYPQWLFLQRRASDHELSKAPIRRHPCVTSNDMTPPTPRVR